MTEIHTKLADYLRDRAKWRLVADLPDDEHNSHALETAAREVEALPSADPRLAQLDVLQQKQRCDVLLPLSDDSGELIERYGLQAPGDVAHIDDLLARLIECEVDASIGFDLPAGGGE